MINCSLLADRWYSDTLNIVDERARSKKGSEHNRTPNITRSNKQQQATTHKQDVIEFVIDVVAILW
jgi:hypothetical protein